MKKILIAGLALSLCIGGVSARHYARRRSARRLHAHRVTKIAKAKISPKITAVRPQFRGLWVTAWGGGIKTPDQIERLVKTAKDANFNALLVQVRKRSDAYYLSDAEPLATDIPPGFDPLALLLEKAHAAGMQVHAWIVVYPTWSDRRHDPPPGSVLALHPDWATYGEDGQPMTLDDGDEGIYLDPGVKEVQDYLAGVAAEIVRKYPADGLHLDYIRYPGERWGYNPEAVNRFEEETGHTPSGDVEGWNQWRRDQVTSLVARISREAKAIRPGIQLSAAVYPTPSESRDERLQDWEKWIRMGLVDFVAPMNYATSRTVFASRSAGLLNRGFSRPVYMGVGGGNKTDAALLSQMELLQLKKAPGIILFDYRGKDPHFWSVLKSRLFQRPAPLPDSIVMPRSEAAMH